VSEFSFVMGNVPKVEGEEKPFVRDDSDNKLFPEIQVKDPRKEGVITDETIAVFDFDTPAYRIAQQMENKFITVVCGDITADLKNKTEFKGKGKKISESSWLGLLNTEREVEGLEPLKVEDFVITEKQKLKYDEDKAMEQAKILVYKKLKQIKLQYGLDKTKLLFGKGKTFRDKLPTVRAYKGNRVDSLRPLLLQKLRDWCVEELGAELPVSRYDGENIECDDLCEFYKAEGYKNYIKNGWLSYVLVSSDKDSLNSAGGVINADLHTGENNPLKGTFKYPQLMLIPATDKCAGNLELVSTSGSPELKGYGFKFLMAQAALNSDQADNYNALGHLVDCGYNMNFGVQAAYRVLQPCTTAKEVLQATIDTFAKLLSNGVEYTDCHGDFHDVDTMTYMNTYFLVAYMTRSYDDKMDFYKLCKAFKVDTSAIENNNLFTAPYEVFDKDNAEVIIESYDSVIDHILNNNLKAYKSGKKQDLVDAMDSIKEILLEQRKLSSEGKTKLVQKNKSTGEIIDHIEGE